MKVTNPLTVYGTCPVIGLISFHSSTIVSISLTTLKLESFIKGAICRIFRTLVSSRIIYAIDFLFKKESTVQFFVCPWIVQLVKVYMGIDDP